MSDFIEMVELWEKKKEKEKREKEIAKISKNNIKIEDIIEGAKKEKENKRKFPEGFDEAVKNALFMGLNDWLEIKDSLDDNQQLNKWYEIWREYFKLETKTIKIWN